MNASDHSWVVRRVRTMLEGAPAVPSSRAPRLTFEMVAPAVREGWIAARCSSLWRHLSMAVMRSRAAGLVDVTMTRLHSAEPARLIAQCAWMAAVAAATNIVMLTVVEQYHFPRRTALVLPAAIAVAAIVAFRLSPAIARAAADKHDD